MNIKQKFLIVNSDMTVNRAPFVKGSQKANDWEFSTGIFDGLKTELLKHLNENYPTGIDEDDDDAFDALIPGMNKVCEAYFKKLFRK